MIGIRVEHLGGDRDDADLDGKVEAEPDAVAVGADGPDVDGRKIGRLGDEDVEPGSLQAGQEPIALGLEVIDDAARRRAEGLGR